MSGAQHTPGPWAEAKTADWMVENDEHNWISWCGIGDQRGEIIALPVWSGRHDDPEFSANISLIAAAPELLAEAEADLQAWESVLEFGLIAPSHTDTIRARIERLRTVIFKAKGPVR